MIMRYFIAIGNRISAQTLNKLLPNIRTNKNPNSKREYIIKRIKDQITSSVSTFLLSVSEVFISFHRQEAQAIV